MKNILPILFSTVLLVVSTLFALIVGEGFLRLKNLDMKNYDMEMWKYAKSLKRPSQNAVLGHEHIPNKTATLQSVDITLNSHGMRGDEISESKSHHRIIFLGSSITLGWGVDFDDILTSRLDKLLNAETKKYEIINAGIGNYNTKRYVELYLAQLKKFDADSIVVQYFVNDAEVLKAGGGNWILRNSQLAVTLLTALNRIINAGNEETLKNHYQSIYSPSSEGFLEMKAALKELANYASNNNKKIFLVMTPDFHNLLDYPFAFIHQKMEQIANEFGIQYLDLLPYFIGIKKDDIWAMPGDPHPNKLGHEIMADAIKQNFDF